MKTKFTLILIVAFSLLLSVMILVGCNGGTPVDEEVFTLYINVNYEGGENFSYEIRRERTVPVRPITVPNDVFDRLDRGNDFHLIGLAFFSQGEYDYINRGLTLLANSFCENNTIQLRAEWFDLILHNAFHSTMAKETYVAVEFGVATQAEWYVEGKLYRAYGVSTLMTAWFENGTLYADRSLTGQGSYRIANFNPEKHMSFSLVPLPRPSIKSRILMGEGGLFGWIETTNGVLESGVSLSRLIDRRNNMQTEYDNVFSAGPLEYMVKNGLIVAARYRGTENWTWRFYFDTEDLESFADKYIPPRVGDFDRAYIFTAELADDSNLSEVRMRGSFDWMPIDEYSIAELTDRLEVFANGVLISNPTLRFFRNLDGTDEVIDSILLGTQRFM